MGGLGKPAQAAGLVCWTAPAVEQLGAKLSLGPGPAGMGQGRQFVLGAGFGGRDGWRRAGRKVGGGTVGLACHAWLLLERLGSPWLEGCGGCRDGRAPGPPLSGRRLTGQQGLTGGWRRHEENENFAKHGAGEMARETACKEERAENARTCLGFAEHSL